MLSFYSINSLFVKVSVFYMCQNNFHSPLLTNIHGGLYLSGASIGSTLLPRSNFKLIIVRSLNHMSIGDRPYSRDLMLRFPQK